MNTRKTLNILFLLSAAFIVLSFVYYNLSEYNKEKAKNNAQTAKAREARQNKLENKIPENDNGQKDNPGVEI